MTPLTLLIATLLASPYASVCRFVVAPDEGVIMYQQSALEAQELRPARVTAIMKVLDRNGRTARECRFRLAPDEKVTVAPSQLPEPGYFVYDMMVFTF